MIDTDAAYNTTLTLLRKQFSDDVADLQPLTGGFFSRAFAFVADGREYVIRVNPAIHARESFAKDDYAWRHFASPDLPIPRIVATGETAGGYYAISERVTGKTLDICSPTERQPVLPDLLDTLEAIGRTDVSASTGYGDWGSDGNGRFASWRAFIASMTDDHTDGFYANWHRFFDESFLERDLYESVVRRMLRLAVDCPEERALVHNDYQFENILTDGQRITGVIDWANALYGDPLYDVAWLTWQAANPDWWYENGVEILRARFGHLPGYAPRVACYQCHIGLDHLRFYARTDNRPGYDFCRAWLIEQMATLPER